MTGCTGGGGPGAGNLKRGIGKSISGGAGGGSGGAGGGSMTGAAFALQRAFPFALAFDSVKAIKLRAAAIFVWFLRLWSESSKSLNSS